MSKLLDIDTDFGVNADGLFIKHSQEIDTGLLDHLRATRDASMTTRMGNNHHVASIPNLIVEQWQREGFDIMKPGIKAREIVARLKAQGLDSFLATNRRV